MNGLSVHKRMRYPRGHIRNVDGKMYSPEQLASQQYVIEIDFVNLCF
jgi:hypothetical protein